MKLNQLIIVVALLGCVATNLPAQTDFFMSLNNLNSGAVNSALEAEFSPGDSGTIYIYYTTNGPADSDIDTGAFLNIAASNVGVVSFTDAASLPFNITLFGMPVSNRWEIPGAASQVQTDSITGLGALNLFSGEGMLEAHNGSGSLFDEGFDIAADAFLFGTIDFEIPMDATPGASVDIVMSTGSAGIFNSGSLVAATFGEATFSIGIEKVMGDVNGDGGVDMGDVGPFVSLIVNREFLDVADINQDGSVNLLDVRPFVDILMP